MRLFPHHLLKVSISGAKFYSIIKYECDTVTDWRWEMWTAFWAEIVKKEGEEEGS